MKIHVTENVDQIIDNYTMLPIVYGKINTVNMPNNCCEEIIVDCMDSIPYSEKDDFFNQIVSKLRLNGKLTVIGIELETLCQDLLNGTTDSEEVNKLLFDKRGIYTIEDIKSEVQNRGLKIEYINLMDVKYEIRCIRAS